MENDVEVAKGLKDLGVWVWHLSDMRLCAVNRAILALPLPACPLCWSHEALHSFGDWFGFLVLAPAKAFFGGGAVEFLTEVKPVLQQHCLRCHNGALPAPALNLTSRETAFAKSASGQDFIVPGAPDRSLLVGAIGRKGTHPKMMPRTDLSLTDDQIGMLREWIEDGAHWPAGDAGRLQAVATTEIP